MDPHTPPSPPRPAAHRPLSRRTRGFTLIELSIVLLISSILLAVGVIRLSRASVFMAQGERVARRLAADLRYAQSEAIVQAKNHYILFTQGDGKYASYAVYRVEAAGDVQVEPTRVLPDSVALTGTRLRAEFSPLGDALEKCEYTVTAPGLTFEITVLEASGSVLLEEV